MGESSYAVGVKHKSFHEARYQIPKKGDFGRKFTIKSKQSMSSSSAVYPLTDTVNLAENEINKGERT